MGRTSGYGHGSVGDAMIDKEGVLGLSADDVTAIKVALQSRRHLLCELFDGTCDPPEGDPCVPLAVIVLLDGKMEVENCLVRPRIYSNAALLELILCLAEKIDECCGKHTTGDLMRVTSVEFLGRGWTPRDVVAIMQSPLQDTTVPIDRNPNAIRIGFSKSFAQDQHIPTTHGLNDPDFKSHNVQVLPDEHLGGLAFVPGTLAIEAPDTIRFDLAASPYMRPSGGWEKGRYRLFLRGTEHLTENQQALADLDNKAFDGEVIEPSGGVMSGDGTAGGDFAAYFVIGPGAFVDTLRVRNVDFVYRNPEGADEVVATMTSPMGNTSITKRFNTIRISFSGPLSQAADHKPTTHGMNDPDFQSHNVQVLTEGARRSIPYVPGSLVVESVDTIRFEVALGSPIVDARGNWPRGTTKYRLYLRGTEDPANARPSLADINDVPLDGEPIAPADGVLSGDGTAGGDFSASFTVRIG
jgi:hypothetical protein